MRISLGTHLTLFLDGWWHRHFPDKAFMCDVKTTAAPFPILSQDHLQIFKKTLCKSSIFKINLINGEQKCLTVQFFKNRLSPEPEKRTQKKNILYETYDRRAVSDFSKFRFK